MAEVEAFAHANPQITYGPVYESRNGWLAISAGMVRADQAASRLAAMKASEIIPRDSYCSDGDAYTGIARTSLGDRARTAAPPVQLGLFDDFDARAMSNDEKRFLQATLALEGYYLALLDGVWGSGSQAALERFTWAVLGEEPTNFHAAVAMLGALVEMDEGGWQPSFYPEFELSLLLPKKRISVVERDAGFVPLKDAQEAIDVLISRSGPEAVGRVHSDPLASHTEHDAPYILRRSDLWVTSLCG